MRSRSHQTGMTLIEVMVVVGIIGSLALLGAVAMDSYQRNARVRNAAQSVAGALALARAEAIRTGNNHLVFFNADGGTDACGNALETSDGQVAPILVLDDGAPGSANQNCCIDAGESRMVERAVPGVSWGVAEADTQAPGDTGGGSIGTGSTFTSPAGTQTAWVLFRPDGVPVGFTSACNAGDAGSGGGGIYVTNGAWDYAAVLAPLGGVRVHAWSTEADAWRD